MIELEQFKRLVAEIQSLGYDEATAADYAALIGDRPITDEQGRIVVMNGDQELARLKLKFFEE